MQEVNKADIAFKDAKMLADVYYKDIRNGFVGFGYYLRAIRDGALWKDSGYGSFNGFLDAEYGRDKSWASRCINLYDKFGAPLGPGELPRLEEQYGAYNVSQLIEMIPMQEELREQVTPDMPVKAIRALKPKKVATVATPEPEPIPEPVDQASSCPPGIQDCQRKEWGTDPEEQKAGKEECRKCWAAWKRRQNKLGAAEVEDAAEVQQETKDVHPEPVLQRHPEKPEPGQERENIGGVPVFSMANKMTAEGAYGWKRSEIINGYLRALHREESFTIANKIIPIEFQVLGNTYKAKYDGCFYVSFKKGDQTFMFVELDRLKAEYAEKYPPKKAKPVATYDKSILQSMIKFEQEQLDMMGPSWMEKQPYHYTKHMMALEAFRMLQAAHEGGESL